MANRKRKGAFRVERDTLGEVRVPADALYGAQTQRASENFAISGIRPKPVFIRATAMVKLSAAEANTELGLLAKRKGRAIERAAREVISGSLDEHFIVDVYQAGAGTSHNMNANEVIANRAIEVLGGRRGDYSILHPNDDVNMAQSTNDTVPTSMRVAALLSLPDLQGALSGLERELKRKSRSFEKVIKSARTHLQDAVPITLGQEFASYASSVATARGRVTTAADALKRIGLGATAAGTGLNAPPRYRSLALRALKRASGIRGLKKAPDMVEALNSMADFLAFTGALRNAAVELARIANDFRLMSSGPNTGLAEIQLPPVQPGSSIMPGKVNPVMAEMLDMVCFQVMGNDSAVLQAAGAGQFELNVMGPVINHNLLQSMEILTKAVTAFTERCVKGVTADKTRCRNYFERSAALATILNPVIGYENATRVVKDSLKSGKNVAELLKENRMLGESELNRLLDPSRITGRKRGK